MRELFVKASPYVIMLAGAVVFAGGLAIGDPHKHWLFMIWGAILFGKSLYALVRKVPNQPPHPQMTARGAIIFGVVMFAVPFLPIVLFLFFDYDWLGRSCSTPKGTGALEACQKILRSGPLAPGEFSKTYNNMGSAYYHKGQYSLAIEYYTHAVNANPGYALAFLNRCGAFLANRDAP